MPPKKSAFQRSGCLVHDKAMFKNVNTEPGVIVMSGEATAAAVESQ